MLLLLLLPLILEEFEGVGARCILAIGKGRARRRAARAAAAIANKAAAEPCLAAPTEDDLIILRRVVAGAVEIILDDGVRGV